MKKSKKTLVIFIVIALLTVAVFIGVQVLSADGKTLIEFKHAGGDSPFSYKNYATVLKTYCDAKGRVDYKALKKNRGRFDEFCASIARLNRKEYEKWTDKEKIAFWINTYNALTIAAVLEYYPISRTLGFRYLAYPGNSIRQIPGVWKKIRFFVMGEKMTLSNIEHGILRKRFAEPRIHLALVCASIGCPALRAEPFTGAKLDRQLDDQTKRFMNDKSKFRIDRDKKIVYLSSIFRWFGKDFIKRYGTDEKFKGFEKMERAVLNFHSRYANEKERSFLEQGGYAIRYLKYDWHLNDKEP